MILYLVRHAQTIANQNSIIQGQSDAMITDEGMKNAGIMAKYFINKQITKIYSSPLGRAYQTACLIADACNIFKENIILDSRLMEIDLKPWVHKRIDDIDKSNNLSSYKTYKTHPAVFRPVSGEDLYDVRLRTSEMYHSIIRNCSSDDNIVIISHAVAIRALLIYLENKSIDCVWSYSIPSASVTEIHVQNGVLNILNIGKIIH